MKQFFIVSILIISSIAAHAQINSSDYHTLRNKLGNSLLKFSKNKKATVAFLGGSITYNPGWRDSTCSYLKRKFPLTEFEFIAAGIPSMGSTPGAFRLERDVLSKGKIDLLFVEAAVNDPTNGRSGKEQIRAMEGIIHHARTTNSEMDIIILYFADPDKMASYNKGLVPEVIINHEKVAEYYDVSSINLAKEVTDRIAAGEFTWEDDFKDLHPAPFGQIVYYNSISTFLENSFDSASESNLKTIKYPLPKKLDEFCYDQGKIISIEKAIVKSDWKIEPNWKPSKGEHTRAGYVNVPMLCADEPGAECSFSFKGKAIGIAVAAGPDAGIIAYQIDGGAWVSQDLFTKWSSQLHLPWYYVLNAELSDKKHTLSITLTENKNSESTGTACRIKHFLINE